MTETGGDEDKYEPISKIIERYNHSIGERAGGRKVMEIDGCPVRITQKKVEGSEQTHTFIYWGAQKIDYPTSDFEMAMKEFRARDDVTSTYGRLDIAYLDQNAKVEGLSPIQHTFITGIPRIPSP